MADRHTTGLPKLTDPGILPDGTLINSRSWQPGRKTFTRQSATHPFQLHLTFDTQPEAAELALEKLADSELQTWSIPIIGPPYQLSRRLDPGVYRYRVKYRHNGQWYWDAAVPGWVLIDIPDVADLRVYTFIPNASGSIRHWPDDLKRIQDLGFNAVHVLPVTHMGTSQSPYAAVDLTSVDPGLLDHADPRCGIEQFDHFVQKAAAIGIRLIIDLVFNHTALDSHIATRRRDWIVPDPNEADGMKRAGWQDEHEWHKWDDVVLLHYAHENHRTRRELWEFMTQYGLFWTERAAHTNGGIRLDNLHSSHHPFLEHFLPKLRAAHPDLFLVGEFFGDWDLMAQRVLDYDLSLLMATPWDLKQAYELRGYINYLHQRRDHFRFLTPATSHDTGSPREEFGNVCELLPRLVVSALMAPGPWGVTQGTEFGLEDRVPFIGRSPRIETPVNPEYADLIRALNRLNQDEALFHEPGTIRFIDQNHPAVLACVRGNEQSRFVIAANLDIHQTHAFEVEIPEIVNAIAIDSINGITTGISNGRLSLDLPPCAYRVFRLQ